MSTESELRGLSLSAEEIHNATNWPLFLIEDYLSLFENITSVAIGVDSQAADLIIHISDSTIHFKQSDIDHTIIQNIGSNSHNQIDAHISDELRHIEELPHGINICEYDSNNNLSLCIGTNYDKRYGYDLINNLLLYFGKAATTTATGANGWQIFKFLYDIKNNLITILRANGSSSFNNIWDDRAILSYS